MAIAVYNAAFDPPLDSAPGIPPYITVLLLLLLLLLLILPLPLLLLLLLLLLILVTNTTTTTTTTATTGELMLYSTLPINNFPNCPQSPLTPHFEDCEDRLELFNLPWVCIRLL